MVGGLVVSLAVNAAVFVFTALILSVCVSCFGAVRADFCGFFTVFCLVCVVCVAFVTNHDVVWFFLCYLIRLDADGEGTKSFVQQRLGGVVVAAVNEEVSGSVWKFGDTVYF